MKNRKHTDRHTHTTLAQTNRQSIKKFFGEILIVDKGFNFKAEWTMILTPQPLMMTV